MSYNPFWRDSNYITLDKMKLSTFDCFWPTKIRNFIWHNCQTICKLCHLCSSCHYLSHVRYIIVTKYVEFTAPQNILKNIILEMPLKWKVIVYGERSGNRALGPIIDIAANIYYGISDLNYLFSCKAVTSTWGELKREILRSR